MVADIGDDRVHAAILEFEQYVHDLLLHDKIKSTKFQCCVWNMIVNGWAVFCRSNACAYNWINLMLKKYKQFQAEGDKQKQGPEAENQLLKQLMHKIYLISNPASNHRLHFLENCVVRATSDQIT